MATYRFGEYQSFEGYDFYAVERKAWYGWTIEKQWSLGFLGNAPAELITQKKALMMETVDRLIKAGHTVL